MTTGYAASIVAMLVWFCSLTEIVVLSTTVPSRVPQLGVEHSSERQVGERGHGHCNPWLRDQSRSPLWQPATGSNKNPLLPALPLFLVCLVTYLLSGSPSGNPSL